MKCPSCKYPETKVVDSRPTENESIRRRRMCLKCGMRFTTYETYGTSSAMPIMVVKKNNTPQIFDKNKILTGVIQACYKRPVQRETLTGLVNDIEREIRESGRNTVHAAEIGQMVMDRLRKIDEISYVRFASVYRAFKDVDTMRKELDNIAEEEPKDEK